MTQLKEKKLVASPDDRKIAVVVPCYKVRNHILGVLQSIPAEVDLVVCVDDACPDGSGDFIEQNCQDKRVLVVRHDVNQGVGGAVLTGFEVALEKAMDVAVKIDGDGQMDPALLPLFVKPILEGRADYTKGNRFWDVKYLRKMPVVRLFGNAVLGFMSKFSTGYWQSMDPTNGYIALHLKAFRLLQREKIAKRFFFESDLLFNLCLIRAVVQDIPMKAVYADEVSNLRVSRIVGPFLKGHLKNFSKRIFYNYILRDFNVASFEIILGLLLLCFGIVEGSAFWYRSVAEGIVTTSGQVMLAALPILVGIQLLVSAINYDVSNTPKEPVHRYIE
ncbi:glycosyltransferase family 2 protein [Kiloniella sp. b19]|uniref:glycosyltransferase family 2 protein n=1 Tax=Kiloniella sp. GXU_MW_B19 TaxID=3141326 RepID=UPI0031D52473